MTLLDRKQDAALVVDVGGGSTELSWVDLKHASLDPARRPPPPHRLPIKAWLSIPVGVVTLAERFPEAHARWRAGLLVGACGMEEIEDLAKRVAAALQEAAERVPQGTVVVTTHGGAAKYGVAALLGWPLSIGRTLGTLTNCHWIELRSDPVTGWRMLSYNAH